MKILSHAGLAFLLFALVSLAAPTTAIAQISPEATRDYAAAVALQNQGLFDLAIDAWTKFINTRRTDPRMDRAFHYLGICYLKDNKLDPALQCFETVVKTYAKSEKLEANYFFLGITQYTLGQSGKAAMYDAAAGTFNTLIEKYPNSKYISQSLFYRGECFYARGKKKQAIEMYQ